MFKDFIRQSGDTQTVWARRLGISAAHLSDLVTGKKLPSLDLAVRIERATQGRVPPSHWVPEPDPGACADMSEDVAT